VVFAAYVAETHGIRIYDANELLGMDAKRLRRSRLRLRGLFKADGGVERVLMYLSRRFTRQRLPRASRDGRVFLDVPLYEAAGA